MRFIGRSAVALGVSCFSLSGSLAFAAQEVAPEASSGAGGIEDIVVTAQRRSESLLSVPLSITAATGDQLAQVGIRQVTDLQFITPGLNVFDGNGFTQTFIRGIGNQVFAADPSVATFIDDVPRIYGTLVSNLVDVERVEILKGAQGGLYGRNATGGVMNIITRQPTTDEVQGDLRVSYGRLNTFRIGGFINLPLSEKVALSVTGERRSRDPYFRNDASATPYTAGMFPTGWNGMTSEQTADFFNSGVENRNVGDESFWATSAKLLLMPTDNFTVKFSADYSDKDDSNGNQQYTIAPGYTQGLLEGALTSIGANPQLPAGFVSSPSGKFRVNSGTAGYIRVKDYGFSGVMNWSLPDVDLTSITAYRSNVYNGYSETAASPVPLYVVGVNYDRSFTYQEFRAASTADGPLSVIGGLTYLKSRTRANNAFVFLRPLPPMQTALSTTRIENWSAYAQATYDFTDSFSLTASGRFIHEKNATDFELSGSETGLTEKKFLPSATISYRLAEGGNVYARWARGFKAGGTNFVADASFFPDPRQGSTFGGETVDTYEVGYRASLLNRTVQVTAAIFYNDFRNLQVTAQPLDKQIAIAILNAGSARSYGAEGSVMWRAMDPLTLSLAAGYLNAQYKDFAISGSSLFRPFDFSGKRMTNAPEMQLSFNANLDQPVSSDLRLVGSVLATYSSSTIWAHSVSELLPDSRQKSYWLSNARLGVRTANDKYEVALFVNNAFNTAYTTYGLSGESIGSQLSWGSPRIFGAEFNLKF